MSLIQLWTFVTFNAFGVSTLLGRTERIPEDLPLQIAVFTMINLFVLHVTSSYDHRWCMSRGSLDTLLDGNDEATNSRIDRNCRRAFCSWLGCGVFLAVIGVSRAKAVMAQGQGHMLPLIILNYFGERQLNLAIYFATNMYIYAATASEASRLPTLAKAVNEEEDVMKGAQKICECAPQHFYPFSFAMWSPTLGLVR
eukprot:COSAG02_NODE_23397_length_720_cov_0.780998_1_plen_197_part_00